MNAETSLVIHYFKRNRGFLENIKPLSFADTVRYIKKNLDLEEDTELRQVQVNLFYAAIGNVDWHGVTTYLKDIKPEKG